MTLAVLDYIPYFLGLIFVCGSGILIFLLRFFVKKIERDVEEKHSNPTDSN